MLGTTWCGDCARSRRLLERLGVPYEWIDIESDDAGAAEVESRNEGRRVVPTIVLDDGTVLVEPSDEALETALGSSPPAGPGGPV